MTKPDEKTSMEQAARFVVQSLKQQLAADYIVVCRTHSRQDDAEIMATFPDNVMTMNKFCRQVRHLLHESDNPHTTHFKSLDDDFLAQTDFAAGVFAAKAQEATSIGIAALWHTAPPTETNAAPMTAALHALASIYAHQQIQQDRKWSQHLTQDLIARAKTGNIQEMVNAIIDHKPDDEMDTLIMVQYQPNTANNPMGPFNQIEVVGSWLKNMGSGLMGANLHFPLAVNAPLFQRMEQNGMLYSVDGDGQYFPQDALFSPLIKSDNRVWIVLPLHTHHRRFGALFIATSSPNSFSPQHMLRYREMSQLLMGAWAVHVLHEEQQKSRLERQLFLDTMNDGIFILSQQIGRFQVDTVNQRFREMFGYHGEGGNVELEAFIKQTNIPKSIAQKLWKSWQSIPFKYTLEKSGEFEMRGADGKLMQISWSNTPVIGNDGSIEHRMLVFHDLMPERMAIEARDVFISRLSHEFRTPLAGIKGYLDLLLNTPKDFSDIEKVKKIAQANRQYILGIQETTNTMLQLVDELLKMNKIAAGEIQPQVSEVQLASLMHTVKRESLKTLEARGQTLIIEMHDDLPNAHIDLQKTHTVFQELLNNASKFSPEGSTIRIRVSLHQSEDDLPNDAPTDVVTPCWLSEIVDAGEGFDEGEVKNLFNIFIRGKYAQKHKIIGSGIGLTKCEGLIQLQRGYIWLRPNTRVNGGCVLVALPLNISAT